MRRFRITTFLLLLTLLATAVLPVGGCRAPLPRLERYGTPPTGAWSTGSEDAPEATLAVLAEHPDPVIRARSKAIAVSMDELAAKRDRRIAELVEAVEDENVRLEEVLLVEVDLDQLPEGEGPGALIPDLRDRAVAAEAEGQLVSAIRSAQIAATLERANPEAVSPGDESASEMLRRLERRYDLIRIGSPEIAAWLLSGETGGAPDGEPGNEGPRSAREVTGGLLNATTLVDQLQRRHVDEPTRADLHRAGLEEVRAVCLLLEQHGLPGSESLLAELEASRIDPERDGTLLTVQELERIRSAVPEAGLPEHFLVRVFVEGAAGALDRRTSLIWPDEHARYLRSFDRRYRGIGARLEKRSDGSVEIDPIPGGPAARAGIRTGDRLDSIEGVPVREVDLVELSEMATDPERTSLRMSVRRGDGTKDFEAVVELDTVQVPLVTGWRQTGLGEDGVPVWDWLADRKGRIAYVRLAGFRPGADRAIRLALKEAQAQARTAGGRLEGVLLDLRRNPGGQVEVAEEVANLFMDRGTIFRSTDGSRRLDEERATRSRSELTGMPLVILVDERSASASELVSGLLQATTDTVLVGDRTYGKGSIQTPTRGLASDTMAVITTGWYLLPRRDVPTTETWRHVDRDRNATGWGVLPDVRVPMSIEETDAALSHRSRWYSGVGRDTAPPDGEVGGPPDPAVEIGLLLLRARATGAS